jgi:formylmethanofuran dehydrogenase subunit B
MPEASTGGRDASLDEAIAAAAGILGASRCPVVAGLGTDIAGAEAAIALARQLGGAFDHMNGAAALHDLDVMREAGWIVTSPQQTRALADLVLLVGPVLTEAWPRLAERLRLDAPPVLTPDRKRRVIRLCPGRAGALPGLGEAGVETIGSATEDLPVMLGVLRAQVAGRRARPLRRQMKLLSDCAAALRAARYGVAVWSAAHLDALAIEMLCGLIDDLNAKTRFAGLPLPPEDNAAGVIQAAGWLTGFPIRTGFGRGKPEHDPWRFDAARMVESGEADAALWIAACSPEPPAWRRRVPLIALAAEGTHFGAPPDVAFTVGRPGVDHDAVMLDGYMGALAAKPASAPGSAPSVAEILRRIAEALRAAAAC